MPAKKTPDVAIGQEFGRLTVTGEPVMLLNPSGSRRRWHCPCRCRCGTETCPQVQNLLSGDATSCGCLLREVTKVASRTHGLARSKLHYVYFAMVARCHNVNSTGFRRYGARGIKVCPEWRQGFAAFKDWALASGYREGLRIERVNNNGDYEPSNCCWATAKEQARNTRRNHWIEAFGERKLLDDWLADPRCKSKRIQITYRIRAGWPPEDALTLPPYSAYHRKS